MVVKNLTMKWCKRESKEFDIKDGKKKKHIKTDEMLWFTFLMEKPIEELTNLYESLGIKDKQYTNEEGNTYLNLSTRFDIPCIFNGRKCSSFEDLVSDGDIFTNNLLCQISINDKGYISCINVLENGEPYSNGLDEFEFEEADDEELPFH